MKRLFIISLLFFASCGSQETRFNSHDEMKSYINDPENGFIVVEETNDLVFEARLTPPIEGENTEECTVNIRVKRKDGGAVLEFNGADQSEVLEREGYLAFDVRKDVQLDIGDESFLPIFHHYERNYGLKPSIDMYFNFSDIKVVSDAEFIYRDQLFGQGRIRLNFSKDLFNKCYVAKT